MEENVYNVSVSSLLVLTAVLKTLPTEQASLSLTKVSSLNLDTVTLNLSC